MKRRVLRPIPLMMILFEIIGNLPQFESLR